MEKLMNSATEYKIFVNGELWREKLEKFVGKIIFSYFLHADAFEINSALGANSNIHNEYKDLKKFGSDCCLKPLVSEMIDLEEQGLVIKTSEGDCTVYFIVALVLGDNLGLNEILEFNISFSSIYFCRFCKEPKNVTQCQCTENNASMRNVLNYNRDVELQTPLETGIRKESIFNTIESFHVTSNYAVDLMHDFHEGICSYVL